MADLNGRKVSRSEAIAFWRSLGRPSPKDRSNALLEEGDVTSCPSYDSDVVTLIVGEGENWTRYDIGMPDDDDLLAQVALRPGMTVFWQHDHDCASRCIDLDAPRKGMYKIVEPDLSKGYIDVYHPISGWKARMLLPDPECGDDLTPWQTGLCAYRTREQAIAEARDWAESEGLPLIV